MEIPPSKPSPQLVEVESRATSDDAPRRAGGGTVLVFTNGHDFTVRHRRPLLEHFDERGWTVVGLAPADSPAVSAFEGLGYPTRPVALTRAGMNPVSEVRALATIWSRYREIRPTLAIHATVKPVLYGSLAARSLGIPVVNLITGLGYLFSGDSNRTKASRSVAAALYRVALSYGRQRIVFQNRDDCDEFVRHAGVPDSLVRIVPGSGVDIDEFMPRDRGEKAGPEPIVALIGRMLQDKGVLHFAEAARRLRSCFPHARFVLVGPVDEHNPSGIDRRTLHELNARTGVEWWGRVHDVRDVHRQAILVVLPSRREGMPMVVLEAAACGLPVVTTDVPGCRESIIDGSTGYLVPFGEPAVLADRIGALLADEALRREFGQNARNLAEKRFASNIIVRQIVDTAMELL